VGIDVTTGEIDIDILYSGKPRSLQVQLQKVLSVVAELEKHGPIRDDDLFDELERNQGISRVDAPKLVGILVRDKTIYSPRPGYYRRTS
jgi:replicative DNA helicase Mcm